MTLKHAKGNLIDMVEQGHFDIIVQGCNCFCTMGSGIAKEIRSRYPLAYDADKATKSGDRSKLGSYSIATFDTPRSFAIVNAYTQYDYNRRGERAIDRFEYDAFEKVLNTLAQMGGTARFGLPYIGMGLAGGDKERIMKIIEQFASMVEYKGGSVTLVEFV